MHTKPVQYLPNSGNKKINCTYPHAFARFKHVHLCSWPQKKAGKYKRTFTRIPITATLHADKCTRYPSRLKFFSRTVTNAFQNAFHILQSTDRIQPQMFAPSQIYPLCTLSSRTILCAPFGHIQNVCDLTYTLIFPVWRSPSILSITGRWALLSWPWSNALKRQ